METSAQQNLQNLSSVRILLVEDDRMNQLIAKTFLLKWGLQLTIANNGKEAVDLVKQKAFDIVLMDIHMPEMDGGEATLRIRAMEDPYFKTLPIIAFSAVVENMEKAYSMGMTDFTSKPINPGDLQNKIIKYTLGTAVQESSRKLNIDFDIYTDGDQEFKGELISLVINNMYELEEVVNRMHMESDPEYFDKTLHKVKPTLVMINDSEHAEILDLLKAMSPRDSAFQELKNQFNLINRQIINALQEEIKSNSQALVLVPAKAA